MSSLIRLHLALVQLLGDRDERGATELTTTAIATAVAATTAVALGALFSDAILDKGRDIVRVITQ